jgi:hypothetical protein
VRRTVTSRYEKEVVETKVQERKRIIDSYYVHCKYCNFFFLRKFPGDDVCDAPKCVVLKETEVEI